MGEIEALLSKYNFTGEVDAKEFLDKLLFEGNNNYLDQFRSDFKNNLLDPVSEKFKKFYGALNKKLEALNDKSIDKLVDPFGLSNITKEYESSIKKYKENMQKFLNKKFETQEESQNESQKKAISLKQNKAGQWITEQGSKYASKEMIEAFQKEQEQKTPAPATPKEKVNELNPVIRNVVQQPVNKLEEANKPADQEQKNFGPQVTLIDFSKNGKDFLVDLFNNLIKKIPIAKDVSTQEKQAKGGLSSWWLLLLGLISDGILLAGKLSKAFEWIIGLPERVFAKWEAMFKESEIVAFISEKWTKMIEGVKRFIKFDDLSVWLNSKWTSAIEKIKEVTKFDEIVESFTKGFERITAPIKNVSQFFENTGKSIEGLFAEGGKFGELTKFFGGIGEAGEGFLSFVTKIRGPFASIIELISKIAPLFEVLEKLLGPIALLIDPVVDSFTTLFNVFGDDKLSFIQKATAVLSSFIGGFGDIVINITDWIAKLSTGAFSWLTGKGFKTDNAVSGALNKFTGGESLGVSLGKKTIDLEKESNTSQGGFFSNIWKGMTSPEKSPLPTKEEIEAGRKNKSNPIPTQDAMIDATSITGVDGKTYVPNSKEDTVIATKSGGSIDKSISNLNKNVQELSKAILAMQKNNNNKSSSNNVSNVSITSNNSSKGSSRDPLHDMRVNWHAMSMKRGAVYG